MSVNKFQYYLIWWCHKTAPIMEVKVIFQHLLFFVTQSDRAENWLLKIGGGGGGAVIVSIQTSAVARVLNTWLHLKGTFSN